MVNNYYYALESCEEARKEENDRGKLRSTLIIYALESCEEARREENDRGKLRSWDGLCHDDPSLFCS